MFQCLSGVVWTLELHRRPDCRFEGQVGRFDIDFIGENKARLLIRGLHAGKTTID